ncbi:MAG: DUF4019 domain-containing protein [bacterium]
MSSGTDGGAEQGAIDAAEEWLALVDAGRYEESWEQASGYLKNVIGKEHFAQSLRGTLPPLGEVRSRELQSRRYATSLPGAPDGEYVVLQYRSSFAHKQSAVETITPMRDEDGAWRISGYYIK